MEGRSRVLLRSRGLTQGTCVRTVIPDELTRTSTKPESVKVTHDSGVATIGDTPKFTGNKNRYTRNRV